MLDAHIFLREFDKFPRRYRWICMDKEEHDIKVEYKEQMVSRYGVENARRATNSYATRIRRVLMNIL